jgi:hypothetical protein
VVEPTAITILIAPAGTRTPREDVFSNTPDKFCPGFSPNALVAVKITEYPGAVFAKVVDAADKSTVCGEAAAVT